MVKANGLIIIPEDRGSPGWREGAGSIAGSKLLRKGFERIHGFQGSNEHQLLENHRNTVIEYPLFP